jgi:hypothetical protein
MFYQMTHHFFTETPGLLEGVRVAIRTEDRRRLVLIAQVLRETLVFLAAHPAAAAADKLENLATGGAWAAVATQFVTLQHHIERLHSALADLREIRRTSPVKGRVIRGRS